MQVTIYSKPNCGSCTQAKNLLTLRGDSYTEVVIGEHITRDEFVEQFPEVRTVPHIIIDGETIGGFERLVEWYSNGGSTPGEGKLSTPSA